MERLHALDTAWLAMEGDGPPIAIGTVAVAEGPPPSDGEIADLLMERLPDMGRLRERLVHGGPVRRPAWTTDATAAFGQQTHRVECCAEHGGLDAMVSGIMETRMPRDRPLWDLWIAQDADADRWALVWRVHHSIADGLGALVLLGHAFDLQPQPGRTLADLAAESGRSRSVAEQLVAGLTALPASLPRLPDVVGAVLPRSPSALSGPVGARRRWVSVTVPLDEVGAVRSALGGTVNDVVLAGVTAGFRRLLEHRGLPTRGRSVRNAVPVSVRPRAGVRSDNEVSLLLAPLPVGVEDPVERLDRLRREVAAMRAFGVPVALAGLLGLADRLVPAAALDAAVRTAGRTVPAWFLDTLTTNVPGPQQPVYLAGRRVQAMFPIIPVAGHTRITTGIFSYDGALHIGVTGDGEHAADVDVLAAGIGAGVAELATLAASAAPAR